MSSQAHHRSPFDDSLSHVDHTPHSCSHASQPCPTKTDLKMLKIKSKVERVPFPIIPSPLVSGIELWIEKVPSVVRILPEADLKKTGV